MHRLRVFLVAVCLLWLTACTVNPVTGKKEFTIMSASQEVAMGEANYSNYQQQQGGQYSVDPELSLYVTQVGQKIASHSGRKDLPYEFTVLNSSVPNAWALPGGKIAINRGLLVLLEDEAQLAAVLGHEIVHAAARHTANQMTKATLLQLGMMAVGVAAEDTSYAQWITMGAGLGGAAWQAKYGRDNELQADKFGIDYMVKAGYEPQAAVELQQTFVALSKGASHDFMSQLFASHPPSEDRVRRNQKLAATYPPGRRNKEAFQRAVSQLKKDAAAYKAQDQAVVDANNGDVSKALASIAKAITQQPNEASFHLTKAQLLLAENNANSALRSFETARSINPDYYMGHLGAALAFKKLDRKADAKQAFATSMTYLQTPTASYYLGEYALEDGDKNTAISYFEFAAGGNGKLADAARVQLQKLQPPTVPAPVTSEQ